MKEGGIKAVMAYYKNLNPRYYNALISMLVFDAVICNEDRHFGNFGVLVDNKTNRIVGTAPIFYNGLSLFYHAMEDDLNNLIEYAETRTPATYTDFVELARLTMGAGQHERLRKLIGVQFKKHSRYNLPLERLKAIERFIQHRVGKLLGE